jgi:hypothetical protein
MVKKHESTGTVTVGDETQTKESELTTEEERILAMRSGARSESNQILGSKLDGVKEEHRADVAARLAMMEAEILAALDANPELRTDRKSRIVDRLKIVRSDD